MNHVPDETLAAIALGEDVEAAARDHVGGCPVCSVEVAELAHVDALMHAEGAAGASAGRLQVAPSGQLWQRILAETKTDTEAKTEMETETDDRSAPPVSDLDARRADQHHAARPAAPPMPAGRRRRAGWLIAAAAACLVAGALLGRTLWSGNDASTQVVVASTTLTTLDASRQKEGTAELLDTRGVQELKVEATSMPAGSGYVEVWLLNKDGKRMVSLGVMPALQAVFPVPPGAISQGYTTVDLSHEQFDDNPQHSGDSIMRGALPA